ncbi:glycoside hydrolase family 18 protein [Hebeloma cylindrosporum]|uniref:Glycoside hydrolase family 18 protein n=1 Tax=Hebeloma cylindrosporum TaxID=76867 RepID=A0A0C3C0S1_HEBCY|nr:glycoside hydrolase family 18 protein [Hebeloma cylindrosporum h7]
MGAFVTITKHTTTSKPYPHVLYVVEFVLEGTHVVIERRYSEFVALHEALGDEFPIPPKRLLLTSLIPSAWVDDELIAERKAGLAKYLSALLWSPEYQKAAVFQDFITRNGINPASGVDFEDVLPSVFLGNHGALSKNLAMGGFLSAAHYPEWAMDSIPPESLDYSRFDILFFGFVTPNASSTIEWALDVISKLKRLIQSAKLSGAGTKIVLSIGGWEGSQWFSHVCSTAVNRMTFVEAVVNAVKTYDLDGIDIDWEFPNSKGSGNPYSPNDAANFLHLIQSLRTALGSSKIISAAVGHTPWLGSNGLPLTDVSSFAENLNFIHIMNYSVWATSSPGANSPLYNSGNLQSTAEAAFSKWSGARFPASQIMLGLPLFGYVFKSRKTSLDAGKRLAMDYSVNALKDAAVKFKGAHEETLVEDSSDVMRPRLTLASWWGRPVPFKSIVKAGALVKRFDGNYGQGDGYNLAWDDASATPYLFNHDKKTLVTFDNTRSLAAKVKFAQANGMAGCSTWSLDQDDGYTLHDVIRTAMGK